MLINLQLSRLCFTNTADYKIKTIHVNICVGPFFKNFFVYLRQDDSNNCGNSFGEKCSS